MPGCCGHSSSTRRTSGGGAAAASAAAAEGSETASTVAEPTRSVPEAFWSCSMSAAGEVESGGTHTLIMSEKCSCSTTFFVAATAMGVHVPGRHSKAVRGHRARRALEAPCPKRSEEILDTCAGSDAAPRSLRQAWSKGASTGGAARRQCAHRP